MTTLAEKMKVYEELTDTLASLEKEIKDEVMSLGSSQNVGRVKATFYPNGKGSWNWEDMAKSLEPDDELVEKYTEVKVTVKWNKLVDELAPPDDFKEKFYTAGTPFVSLSVK